MQISLSLWEWRVHATLHPASLHKAAGNSFNLFKLTRSGSDRDVSLLRSSQDARLDDGGVMFGFKTRLMKEIQKIYLKSYRNITTASIFLSLIRARLAFISLRSKHHLHFVSSSSTGRTLQRRSHRDSQLKLFSALAHSWKSWGIKANISFQCIPSAPLLCSTGSLFISVVDRTTHYEMDWSNELRLNKGLGLGSIQYECGVLIRLGWVLYPCSLEIYEWFITTCESFMSLYLITFVF